MEMGPEARLKRTRMETFMKLRDHLSFQVGKLRPGYGERCVQCEENPENHCFMRQRPPDGVHLFSGPRNTSLSSEICWRGAVWVFKGTPRRCCSLSTFWILGAPGWPSRGLCRGGADLSSLLRDVIEEGRAGGAHCQEQ